MKNKNLLSRKNSKSKTETLALGAMLTALVIVLQLLGQFIHIGSVASVSLVLIPIVIGAATCSPALGAWLGLVFSVVVLLQPDTAVFYGSVLRLQRCRYSYHRTREGHSLRTLRRACVQGV